MKHNTKTVVVQGLGFVGAVMSLVVAHSKENYQVIGIDLPQNQNLVDKLNEGIFPIQSSDPKVKVLFNEALRKGNFRATCDPQVYSDADVIIVDINLDVQKGVHDDKLHSNYSLSLDGFTKAMESIAIRCKEDVLVLVETTVPPGTCMKVVKPIFERIFNERGLKHNFKIGHSYERVMPGPNYVDSIMNFYRVYSGVNETSAVAVEQFLKTIISTAKYPLTRLNNTNSSEMSKVLENSFRAMNIAFIQEWTEFAEKSDVNLFEVIEAIRMRSTHKNIMRPGLGVGGYCLTKDPLLASWAAQHFFDAPALKQSEKAVKINDTMPQHTFQTIKNSFENKLKGKIMLLLGISYLQDVGDTRFTPVETIYEKLNDEGVSLVLHDPYVEYWEEYDIKTSSTKDINSINYDAIILGTPHTSYFEDGIIESILKNQSDLIFFDPHGAVSDSLRKGFTNHKFKIIGRGDV